MSFSCFAVVVVVVLFVELDLTPELTLEAGAEEGRRFCCIVDAVEG